VTNWATPDNRARMIVDQRGMEWEVYDESSWSLELALEWDFLPQAENPGLIFSSNAGRKRLWPCPGNWQTMNNAGLLELLEKARSII
jgi:hypothetical protein